MAGVAREHSSEAAEAAPAPPERAGVAGRPGDLLALARSLQSTAGNAAVQRLAAIARLPVELAPPATYDTVDELLSGIGGEPEKPPYTMEKYHRAFRFLDKAGHDQLQAAFRGLEQRGGFHRLLGWIAFAEGVDRNRIKMAMLAWKERNRTSRAMFEIEHRSELAALTTLDRETFLDWISLEWGEVSMMKGMKGFQALSQAEQDRLLVYAGGSLSVSSGVPSQLQTLFADPKANLEEAATFTKFLHAQAGLGSHVGATSDKRLPDWEELEGPTEVKRFKFRSGRADALRYEATIGAVAASKIPIYLPKAFDTTKGLHIPTIGEVVDILSRGPEQVRRMVKEVHVNPGRNPEDSYWAKQPGYAKKDFRSYMTAGADGIVDIYPSPNPHNADSARTSIAHESGHTVSQKLWGDNTKNQGWKPWRDAMKSDNLSPSTYGKSSPAEDFAESWALFMEVRGRPREEELRILFPARWAILATLW
jgi:hypothetical protein